MLRVSILVRPMKTSSTQNHKPARTRLRVLSVARTSGVRMVEHATEHTRYPPTRQPRPLTRIHTEGYHRHDARLVAGCNNFFIPSDPVHQSRSASARRLSPEPVQSAKSALTGQASPFIRRASCARNSADRTSAEYRNARFAKNQSHDGYGDETDSDLARRLRPTRQFLRVDQSLESRSPRFSAPIHVVTGPDSASLAVIEPRPRHADLPRRHDP